MGLIACRRRQGSHTIDAAPSQTCSALSPLSMAELASLVADVSSPGLLQDGSMSGKQAGVEHAQSILGDNVHEALESVLEDQ